MRTFYQGLLSLFCAALFLFSGEAKAQNVVYGNEWINYSQPYYKIKVAKDGIYRLTYANLTAAGISTVNPEKLQLFRRGKEVAIYVNDAAPANSLNTGDYIEFYGQRNDGVLDSALFFKRADKIHDFYSFFTDTATYFLTYGSANGKRMIERTSVTTGLTPEPRHYAEKIKFYTDVYYQGIIYSTTALTSLPWADKGESFGTAGFEKSRKDTIGGLSFLDNTGRKPVIKFGVLGEYFNKHSAKFLVKPPGQPERLLTNSETGVAGVLSFPAFNFITPQFQIEYSDITSSGILYVRTAVPDSALTGTPNRDQLALSYLRIKYARANNLEGKNKIIFTDSTRSTSSYFLFDNPPPNAVAYDITDPYNIIRTTGTAPANGKTGFVFQPSANERKIVIANPQAFISPVYFKSNPLTQIPASNTYDYIIITHSSLRKPVANTPYLDPPVDYAAYRATPAGGGYNPLVVNIDQVYDQYHYGEKSSQSITNFMDWMIKNGNPKFLFLIGKGVVRSFGKGTYRVNPLKTVNLGRGLDLIPTAGDPSSDILFTSNWKVRNTTDTTKVMRSYAPKVPVGRITAMAPEEIVAYLEKVKTTESLGLEDWRKNVLHLGGGKTNAEITAFSRYLDNYKNKIEGPLLGANVKSILRSNNGVPIQTININSEINAGLSLITFFGHSSSGTSDLDIGLVSDPINGYNNNGKYPLILMNGCQSGDAFLLRDITTKKLSFGEDWILTPNKGALLFIGSTFTSLPYTLNNFSSNFYTTAFTDSTYYGKPIGEIHKGTIKKAEKSFASDINSISLLNIMALQGDPAVKLVSPDKPDYLVKTNGLKLQSNPAGSSVTATSSQFDIIIDIKNRGKALDDSLSIRVKRTLPNNKVITYKTKRFAPVYNEATYAYTISGNAEGYGQNTFEVFLDSDSTIAELDETNNTATFSQFLNAAGAITLLPVEYSIVNTLTPKLIGQPSDLLIGKKDYYFELDTVNTFNSGFKRSQVVQNANVTPSWTVNLLPKDSLVYYWRIRFNNINANEDTIWSVSSFRYINNSSNGWSQSHYSQFDKAEKNGIKIDPATKKWEFENTFREVQLKTVGGGVRFSYPPYGIFFDNSAELKDCWANTSVARMIFAVFDNKTLTPYTGALGATRCGDAAPVKNFYVVLFNTSKNRSQLLTFIGSIPKGFYVSLISVNSVPFSTFTKAEKDSLKTLGSQMIDGLVTGRPYAMVGIKGKVTGTLLQEKSSDPNASATAQLSESISLTQVIQGSGSQGKIVSTIIGPAKAWTSLVHTVKKSGNDAYKLDLYGIDKDGVRSDVPLQADIKNSNLNISTIDAAQYPYLQLEIEKTDPARSAPQLKQWMVLYQGVPEGIIRPDLVSATEYDNLNSKAVNGNVNLKFAFSNISKIDFDDSLSIRRSIMSGNTTVMADTIKVKKLMQGDSVLFEYNFSTANLKGDNVLRVEVNPRILPEQYYFNNYLEFPFTVGNRNLPPVLDVAFDGVHIMDGDFVSPNPHINIVLKDKDRQDYIKDPNNLLIYLKYPGENTYRPAVDLNDASLVVVSPPNSTQDKHDLEVQFNPKNLPDGVYSLAVQGKDNSNQKSGFEPYAVNFEVKNESAITHFYPYPNPFTSSTRFVFTVTGTLENLPKNMKVQVMTITGKVVREIQKDELEATGPIRIGNNMSAPWDGTDEYGDKLANGVYLYRVVMDKSPLEEMKHRKTGADKAFTKEYGKLYILR